MGPVDVTSSPRRATSRPRSTHAAAATTVLALLSAGCGQDAGFWDAYAEIVVEEDARGDLGLARIRHHLDAADPAVRTVAVRALGRLEDPAQLERLESLLADPDPGVRATAAMAVAQAVFGGDPESALAMLSARVGEETDAAALGALATNLGRLSVRGDDQRRTAAAGLALAAERLWPEEGVASEQNGRTGQFGMTRGIEAFVQARERDLTPRNSDTPELPDDDLAGRLGLARGLEAFARGGHGLARRDGTSGRSLAGWARLLAETRDSAAEERSARIRRLAVAALVHDGRLRGEDALRFLADSDPGVRRLAVAAVGAASAGEAVPGAASAGAEPEASFATAIHTALADLHPSVRVAALRAFDRRLRAAEGCAPLLRAFADPAPHVSLVAMGLAARPCPEADAQRDALRDVVREVDTPGGDWRRPARALHSLATVAPTEAAPLVARFARHGSPFARAWAARAAALTHDADALRALVEDPDPNARTAALDGLGAVVGADARDLYAAQLMHDDPLLVMTAARLLREHAPDDLPVPELLNALARFTATGRETVRDVRVALLETVGAGTYEQADLAPYLADFDPLLAARAQALAEAAQAEPPETPQAEPGASAKRPRPPLTPAPPVPASRLQELDRSSVVLRMAGLGEVVIALLPRSAATNADRFARLAEAGYFDGLTFHRVEPNFVVQGGSPHANEYAGDGPYSRDEISSRPHWRGTVGLSTRGRDTGDAQIFVNLVDNVRLDFNYTIFGEVVAGMDLVDTMQEGALIEEARVERR